MCLLLDKSLSCSPPLKHLGFPVKSGLYNGATVLASDIGMGWIWEPQPRHSDAQTLKTL